MEPTRPLSHSVSSTHEYERCPRRYRFAYVERRPESDLVPAGWRFGSVVHAGLEAAYRHRSVRGGDGPMTDCMPAAVASTHLSIAAEELHQVGTVGRALGIVRRVLEHEDLAGDDVLGVECLLVGATPAGLPVAGYADLVLRVDADTLEIRDHKVTRWARTPEDLAEDFQLNVYGWLARERWPWATTILASHHYPMLGRVVRVELAPASMRTAIDRVERVARAAEVDEVFIPSPGEHCGDCAWRSLCPASAIELRSESGMPD